MSVVLKTRFSQANAGPQISATRPAPSSARVVQLITIRQPRPQPAVWTIPAMLVLFFGSIIGMFWYASSVLEVLRAPSLEPGLALPDPEQSGGFAETVTPPFTDVIAPFPTAPNLPEAAVPVAAAKGNPNDGIAIPASSLQVSYGAVTEATKPDPLVEAIAEQIKDTPAVTEEPKKEETAQVAVKSSGPSIDDMLDKAQGRLDATDNKGALEIYNRILARDHGNREALTGKGNALQLAGQYGEAVGVYHQLLKLNKKDETARVELASALGELGSADASAELQHMVSSSPDFAAGQAALGQALVKQNKALAALPHVWRAAELEPDNIVYRLDLAITYDKMGHSSEAVEFYRSALKDADADNDTQPDLPISPPEIQRRADYLEKMMASANKVASADTGKE